MTSKAQRASEHDPSKAVAFETGALGQEHQHLWEFVQDAGSQAPPDLLEPLQWGPARCALASPSGDSNGLSGRQTADLEDHKRSHIAIFWLHTGKIYAMLNK